MKFSRTWEAVAGSLLGAALVVLAPPAAAQPVPPCVPSVEPRPAYAAPGQPPSFEVWRDIDLSGEEGCMGAARGRQALAVALAGRFVGSETIHAVAARFGAVSTTQGLRYWSVTDGAWRVLVDEAYAVDDPAARRPRADFTAAEMLAGHPLYFAQNDTRSSGLNIYEMTAHAPAPDRLVVEIVNTTPIRFAFITLFDAGALRSIHFVDRLGPDTWSYYGLSVVEAGPVDGHEKSFVNRAAAFYRFLAGTDATAEPPLAR